MMTGVYGAYPGRLLLICGIKSSVDPADPWIQDQARSGQRGVILQPKIMCIDGCGEKYGITSSSFIV